MKPKKRNNTRRPRTVAAPPTPVVVQLQQPPAPVEQKKSPLRNLFEKWVAPLVLALIVAAVSYTFLDRLTKVENILADLQKTVTELDTSYSKDSETKGTVAADIKQLEIDVGVLKEEVQRLLLK
jgi:hypothetical protein